MAKLRIRNASDITSLLRYERDVNLDEDPIAAFVDDYYVRLPIQCGLKGCHQWRKDGAILRTERGIHTNAGHICGSRFRGFTEKYDEFKRSQLTPRYRDEVVAFKRKSDAVLSAIEKLEARRDALRTKVRNFTAMFPNLARGLQQRAARSETAVQTVKERSDREIEDMMAATRGLTRERARYKSETIGHLQGLAVFNVQAWDIQNFRTEAQGVFDLDVVHCSYTKLAGAARWVEDYDEECRQFESRIAAGEAFFTAANLALLGHVGMSDEEKAKLASLDVNALSRRREASPVRAKGPLKAEPMSKFDKFARSFAKSIYGTGS